VNNTKYIPNSIPTKCTPKVSVRPFSMVEDPEFKAMVSALDPCMHVPARSTVKRRLVAVEKQVRVALRK
jgi:hypothetical protein